MNNSVINKRTSVLMQSSQKTNFSDLQLIGQCIYSIIIIFSLLRVTHIIRMISNLDKNYERSFNEQIHDSKSVLTLLGYIIIMINGSESDGPRSVPM